MHLWLVTLTLVPLLGMDRGEWAELGLSEA